MPVFMKCPSRHNKLNECIKTGPDKPSYGRTWVCESQDMCWWKVYCCNISSALRVFVSNPRGLEVRRRGAIKDCTFRLCACVCEMSVKLAGNVEIFMQMWKLLIKSHLAVQVENVFGVGNVNMFGQSYHDEQVQPVNLNTSEEWRLDIDGWFHWSAIRSVARSLTWF